MDERSAICFGFDEQNKDRSKRLADQLGRVIQINAELR